MKLPQPRYSLFVLSLLLSVCANAQKVVVIDKSTLLPIQHVSVYSKDYSSFRSTTTNSRGVANIDFNFKKITFSHLNYQKLILTSVSDTLYMQPINHETDEVTITYNEPKWIRPLLKKFIKTKKHKYYTKSLAANYNYSTKSIKKDNYYQFDSNGLIFTKSNDYDKYEFFPEQNLITSSDSTTLTDIINLRRMLYEESIDDFDSSFLSEHIFGVNDEYQGNPNEIEFTFRSKKYPKDHGRFLMDTTNIIILRASRIASREANQAHRIKPAMLSMAKFLSGFAIRLWDTNYFVDYQEYNNIFIPKNIKFKFNYYSYEKYVDKNNEKLNQDMGSQGFSNMESTLTIAPIDNVNVEDSLKIELPKTWYVRINSDEFRQNEIKLSHLPSNFQLLE